MDAHSKQNGLEDTALPRGYADRLSSEQNFVPFLASQVSVMTALK